MKRLGLNPGNLEHIVNVTLEPVSFSPGSHLGWGQEWHAVHRGDNYVMPPDQGLGVEVEGFCISVENGKRTNYMSLLRMWREKCREEND